MSTAVDHLLSVVGRKVTSPKVVNFKKGKVFGLDVVQGKWTYLSIVCDIALQYHYEDTSVMTSSDLLVSDQEEELIRLLIVDSDFAEP